MITRKLSFEIQEEVAECSRGHYELSTVCKYCTPICQAFGIRMVNLNKARWGFAYLEWPVFDIMAPVKVILLITMKAGLFTPQLFF